MTSAAAMYPDEVQVLLVEDEEADARLLITLFEIHGFHGRVHWVKDGEAAVHFITKQGAYATERTPDLMILDLNLPKMSGRDVLKFIREEPALEGLPVLVMTTSSAPGDMRDSYELRAKSFITKPRDLVDFERLVKRILSIELNLASLRRPRGS